MPAARSASPSQGDSVGDISPAPLSTFSLHRPQEPRPPHAEGMKTPCSFSVDRRLWPPRHASSRSPPLIESLTSP